jgi:alkylresorcinol/alkylpyrone synthase
MTRVNSLSSVVPTHEINLEETTSFLAAHAAEAARPRLRRMLEASGNRIRHAVLPLEELARLGGAGERAELYRRHASALGERAVAGFAERGVLDAERVTTLIFVSGTGWVAPSIDTHLVRRFGLRPTVRRISLTQLGCAGGVAALSLAAEIVRRDPAERVLVVSVELPSLQLQLAEPSYSELLAAAQFGDGAAAAVVSSGGDGPEILATESVLLPEIDEGGRVVPTETGLRLVASAGLPRVIRSRVRGLVDGLARRADVDGRAFSFVVAHPRGREVLDAVTDGLSLDRASLAGSWAVWEEGGNMISASVYRALSHVSRHEPPRPGDLGTMLAFGTGLACEMALLRWGSAPDVAYA